MAGRRSVSGRPNARFRFSFFGRCRRANERRGAPRRRRRRPMNHDLFITLMKSNSAPLPRDTTARPATAAAAALVQDGAMCMGSTPPGWTCFTAATSASVPVVVAAAAAASMSTSGVERACNTRWRGRLPPLCGCPFLYLHL